MKPRILLLDEPHPKAKAILEDVAEFTTKINSSYEGIFTKLEHIHFDNGITPTNLIKFVATPCTGTDHIHAEYCKANNINIIHLDDAWKANEGREITSTAEHTWSLIMQLAKMNRMQLKDKTLGIIGHGRIGKQIAEYAVSFGMLVNVYDKYKKAWVNYGETGFYVNEPLEKILTDSNIITLHVPLNEETRGMIGKEQFDMMKPGALLVNTSRAEIVDEKALMETMLKEKTAGYADDFLNSHSLNFIALAGISHNKTPGSIILTNHIAGNCLEAREATDIYIAEKIKEYINGNL